MHVINSEKFDILSNKDTDISIYNLSEVTHAIQSYPNYKLLLYTMDSLDNFEIKSHDFFEKLKTYCTENFKYSLLHIVDTNQQEIKIWITPLVSSA